MKRYEYMISKYPKITTEYFKTTCPAKHAKKSFAPIDVECPHKKDKKIDCQECHRQYWGGELKEEEKEWL